MQTVTEIDLLRHGETIAGPCFLGSTDAALSEAGWQAMQATVDVSHKEKNYQKVISSPLIRCARFAQPYSQKSELPLIIEDNLREIHFGDWEARTTEDVWNTQESLLSAFWNDPINNTPPDAEKFSYFQSRVNGAFEKIIKTYAGERILLVCHGGVIRQIVANILSLSFKQSQQIRFDYAGLTRIECYDGNMNFRFINQKY